MDNQLIASIAAVINQKEVDGEILDSNTAISVVSNVGNSFVTDLNTVWWWRSIKSPWTIVEYDGNFKEKLLSLMDNNNEHYFLVVTDETPRPWPVIKARLSDIMKIIESHRFFEYFICNLTYTFCIFDTHHNSFIVCDCRSNN